MTVVGSPEPLVRPEIIKLNRYVPGKPIEEVQRELKLSKVTKLASNENPLGPSPKALKAIRNALKNLAYYPDDSCYYLKKALAKHHQISENQLVLGNGAVEIIRMLMETFIEAGDEVVLGTPSFPIYRDDVLQKRGKLVEVPLDSAWHYNLKAMKSSMTPKTKMIAICNPNNPTGTLIKRNEFNSFLLEIPKRVLTVLDEAYSDFIEDKNYGSSLEYVRQDLPVVVLRTFSKAYGLAGIRIGYGVAIEDLTKQINKVRPMFSVNSLAQAAAATALKDSTHYERTRKLIWREKKYLYAKVKALGISFIETQANFFVINIGGDDQLLFQKLLQEGVIIRPGTPLGMPGWIRVSIGTHQENETFLRALSRHLPLRKLR